MPALSIPPCSSRPSLAPFLDRSRLRGVAPAGALVPHDGLFSSADLVSFGAAAGRGGRGPPSSPPPHQAQPTRPTGEWSGHPTPLAWILSVASPAWEEMEGPTSWRMRSSIRR